jgi:hypothetical protein
LIGLTSLRINGGLIVSPELNRRRALIVLGKIDEILAWEKTKEQERDERFVELGQYLCEVRAGQYWRLENLKSFDEFLEKRSPESRRKAYYLMAIHEHLTRIPKRQLREVGWTKARELVKVARREPPLLGRENIYFVLGTFVLVEPEMHDCGYSVLGEPSARESSLA